MVTSPPQSSRIIRASAVAAALIAATASPAPARTIEAQPRIVAAGPTLGTGELRRDSLVERSSHLTVVVHLAARHPRELDRVVAAVSDPTSRSYRRHLTAAQVRRRFAPARSTVTELRRWARSHGLRVVHVARNRKLVILSAGVRRFEAAFSTRLRVRTTAAGTERVLERPARMPARLARRVLHVAGLTGDAVPVPAAASTPATGKLFPGPCSRWWREKPATGHTAYDEQQSWLPCGYTPSQVRSAYRVDELLNRGIDGRGQRVAVILWSSSPTIETDLAEYSRRNGLPPADLTLAPPRTPADGNGDKAPFHLEQTLDLETLHTIAPRAKLLFQEVGTNHWRFYIAAINDIAAESRAQAISLSITLAGEMAVNSNDADDEVFKFAAAQGVGIYAGTGDDGDSRPATGAPEGSREPNWPSASAQITAVGGSSLAIGADGERLFETAWGTSRSKLGSGGWTPAPPGEWFAGSTGGTSHLRAQPAYQREAVPQYFSHYWRDRPGSNRFPVPVIPARVVPDVAILGDSYTGLMIGQTLAYPGGSDAYTEFAAGGTSLSAPLFAGIMLLADQLAGHAHGFANPALYRLAATPAFKDITAPGRAVSTVFRRYTNGLDASGGIEELLVTMSQIRTLLSIPGYDDSTGLGTPDALELAERLAAPPAVPVATPSPPPTPTATASPPPDTTKPADTRRRARPRCRARVSIRLPRGRGRVIRAALHVNGARRRRVAGRDLRNVRYTRRSSRAIRLRVAARTSRGRLLQVRVRLSRCSR